MNRKRPAAASPADPPRLTVAQTWRQLLANDFFRETIALGPPSRWPRHPILRPVVLALALVPSMVWSARNFGYYGDADFWNERTGRIWALSGLIYLLAAGAQRVNASNWMRERRDQIAPGDRAHSPSADKIALGYVFPNIAGERMGIVLAALIIAWSLNWMFWDFLLLMVLALALLKLVVPVRLTGPQIQGYFRETEPSLFAVWGKQIATVLVFGAIVWGVKVFFGEELAMFGGLKFSDAMQQLLMAHHWPIQLVPPITFIFALFFFIAVYRLTYLTILWNFQQQHGSVDELAASYWRPASRKASALLSEDELAPVKKKKKPQRKRRGWER